MAKRIFAVLAVLLLALAAWVNTKPSDFSVARSGVVHAPPNEVFEIVNDFHCWTLWSPYDGLDPAMKKTFGGSGVGPGSSYAWDGNVKAGAGKMTILDVKRDQEVHLKLELLRPMAATNDVHFLFAPAKGGTQVTWLMRGKNGFLGKAAGTFLNIDKLVGRDFEVGLANMDRVPRWHR